MVKYMHQIVLIDTKLVVQKSRFVFFYVDEATNVDYQSWLVVCVYIVDCWKCIPILINLGASGEWWHNK
jgi:hypothetical protein